MAKIMISAVLVTVFFSQALVRRAAVLGIKHCPCKTEVGEVAAVALGTAVSLMGRLTAKAQRTTLLAHFPSIHGGRGLSQEDRCKASHRAVLCIVPSFAWRWRERPRLDSRIGA